MTPNRLLLPLVLTVLTLSSTAYAQDAGALAKGEVFVKAETVKGSDVPRMIVTAVVDAPPDKVYEVVTNCDRFPDRLPRILEAEFLSRSETKARCRVTVDIPFPFGNLTAVTDDVRQKGPSEWFRKWRLVKGDYDSLTGSFVLTPFQGQPGRTLLVYTIHAVPKSAVPDFLREKAQRSSLPAMVERIRKEVKKL